MNRIFLVRHGESEGNVDKSRYRVKGDHEIELTERGTLQAREAGKFLVNYYEDLAAQQTIRVGQVRLWTSPYTRARQTSQGIVDVLQDQGRESLLRDKPGDKFSTYWRENIRLSEQQFGLLNGIADESVVDHYPDVHDDYERAGKFYARPPGGESRFDVAIRVHQMFGTLHRDCERHGIEDVIVVCHGTTLRAFVMEWLHLPVEWFLEEPNPSNCAIRLLEKGEDKGYIFGGGTP